MGVQCEHNSKLRKEGLCKPCSEKKPYMVFRLCEVKTCPGGEACIHGGYFWGPGAPEALQGQPARWTQEKRIVLYTAESVRESLNPKWDEYYAKLALGQAPNWKCDQRTKENFCLSQWLMDELIAKGCPQEDRIFVQNFFNRKARAESDLYELAARAMNTFVEGNIERYRGR